MPKSLLCMMEPSFPGLQRKAGHEFLLICLHLQVLLYLLDCLYRNPRVFALPLSDSHPISLHGADLPQGLTPNRKQRQDGVMNPESRPSSLILRHLADLPCPALRAAHPHMKTSIHAWHHLFFFGVTKADNSCTTPQERAMNQL